MNAKTKTARQINAERKKEGKPPLNFALFRKVIKKLEAAPEAYSQDTFATESELAPCGTTACIAGWATVLSGSAKHTQIRRIDLIAARVGRQQLGLDHNEANTLFDGHAAFNWPEPYCDQLLRATTKQQEARAAIRYLTHIIKTGKVTG